MWILSYITVIQVNHKCKFQQSFSIVFKITNVTKHISFSRTYPFCPIGDYQPPNGQSYYTTTHTANYSTAVPLNAPTVPHHSTLPYIVPTEETLLLNASSQTHSRDSPHSLTVSKYFLYCTYTYVCKYVSTYIKLLPASNCL